MSAMARQVEDKNCFTKLKQLGCCNTISNHEVLKRHFAGERADKKISPLLGL